MALLVQLCVFVDKFRENGSAKGDEFGIAPIARPREIDGNDVTDAPGIGIHHHNAVREEDRFLDIVCDQNDGLRIFSRQARDLLLQPEPRQRIESTQRLVEQE